jgi:hypothetical protein
MASGKTLQLGDLEVLPVIDVTSSVDPSQLADKPPEVWELLQDLLTAEGKYEGATGGYLIRHRGNDRLALVDLGLGKLSMFGRPGQALMLDSLAELGYRPEDVTDVIFTHLHLDHIGWASDEGAPVFVNATYRCHQADWDHWVDGRTTGRTLLVRGGHVVERGLAAVLRSLHRAQADREADFVVERVVVVADEPTLAEGTGRLVTREQRLNLLRVVGRREPAVVAGELARTLVVEPDRALQRSGPDLAEPPHTSTVATGSRCVSGKRTRWRSRNSSTSRSCSEGANARTSVSTATAPMWVERSWKLRVMIGTSLSPRVCRPWVSSQWVTRSPA